jgi:hypothetical protein
VEAGFRAANEFDSKSTSFVLASIKITDGFLRSGSLAKFEKTVVARSGAKAVDGVPKIPPKVFCLCRQPTDCQPPAWELVISDF